MVPSDLDDDPPQTTGSRVLRQHRDCLQALLKRAVGAGGGDSAQVKREVSALVDQLADDLVRLYSLSERGVLSRSDHLIVLPALERLRNSLRFWQHRRRALRDTLHRAIETIGDGAP